jgi:hypothetical protein
MLSNMDLRQRLLDFDASISSYKATDHPSRQTLDIFNALLAVAKEQHADDPVIQAIRPGEEDGMDDSSMDAGSMRAAVGQVLSAQGVTGSGSVRLA